MTPYTWRLSALRSAAARKTYITRRQQTQFDDYPLHTGSLFYLAIIGCHFLSSCLSHQRGLFNGPPTREAEKQREAKKDSCPIK